MMKRIISVFVLSLMLLSVMAQSGKKDFSLKSPDGSLEVSVNFRDYCFYSISKNGQVVVEPSRINLQLADGLVLGERASVVNAEQKEIRETVKTVWGSRAEMSDFCNELTINFKGDYSLIFRAYDKGIAYRWQTKMKGNITVKDEEFEMSFADNHTVWMGGGSNFQSSHEFVYKPYLIQEVPAASITPVLVEMPKNIKLLVTDADLRDYPGMYIEKRQPNSFNELHATFPPYPKRVEQGNWCQFGMPVVEAEDYIAKTSGNRSFPWRVLVVSDEDAELVDNDMVYLLASPLELEDTQWIKPGKVSWEWWNAWNLEGVDFRTGINTKTYEYYIDFAAENGLEYVIMDEGWSDQFDLTMMLPDVDVPHLVKYGKEKGVGIILWCVWHTLDRQMDEAFDIFEQWGVAGIKVDFVDRDDQLAVNFYERCTREAAKHKLLVDFHGCSKPTGLHRTYPNLVNYEGVLGNEYNKFASEDSLPVPEHNVRLAFTRMLCGPMDYTPGAMRNSTKSMHHKSGEMPVSHGTRCHQLGMYVVYEAPLQMLCDAPTEYRKYPETLRLLSEVPVTWDDTKVLAAKYNDYVVVARRKGDSWWIGALNDWTERKLTVDLSFLEAGNYEAEMLIDGLNADRRADDYQFKTKSIKSTDKLEIVLKPGGGALIKLKP